MGPGDNGMAADDDSPDAPEARRLIDALLDERITPADRARLEQLVGEEPAIARLYVRSVHLWCSLPLYVSRPDAALSISAFLDGEDPAEPKGTPRMHDTMILPAIREVAGEPPVAAPAPIAIPARPVPSRAATANQRWRARRLAGLAAVLTIGTGAAWFAWPANLPARITATAGAVLEGGSSPTPGTPLTAGRSLRLVNGAIELTFDRGAVVTVEAPARLDVLDAGAVVLRYGTLTAHVPPPARGFRVTTAGLGVVDQGTNFGVRTNADATGAEVQVFTGVVDATALDAANRPTSAPVAVVASHAVRHDQGSTPLVPVAFTPAAFQRDIAAVRVPLAWHGTGDHLSPGAADPYWQVVSVPGNASGQPRPAVVISALREEYARNLPGAQWISTAADPPNIPVGDYLFRTTVDLSGYDAATAVVKADVAADDLVADVLVNGTSNGVQTPSDTPKASISQSHTLSITRGWRTGVNQVDVVVRNLPVLRPKAANGMAVQLGWTATASPIVRR